MAGPDIGISLARAESDGSSKLEPTTESFISYRRGLEEVLVWDPTHPLPQQIWGSLKKEKGSESTSHSELDG